MYSRPGLVGVKGVSEQEGQTWSIFELALLYLSGLLFITTEAVQGSERSKGDE